MTKPVMTLQALYDWLNVPASSFDDLNPLPWEYNQRRFLFKSYASWMKQRKGLPIDQALSNACMPGLRDLCDLLGLSDRYKPLHRRVMHAYDNIYLPLRRTMNDLHESAYIAIQTAWCNDELTNDDAEGLLRQLDEAQDSLRNETYARTVSSVRLRFVRRTLLPRLIERMAEHP